MSETKELVEAALFASGRSLSLKELAKTCGVGNLGDIKGVVEDLMREYEEKNAGVRIYKDSDGYYMRVKTDLEKSIVHLIPEADMPEAMLKTLAVIAYEQPVKQSDLVKERGNRIYYYVKKLNEQELIEAKKAGRTKILKTTPKFKEYFKIEDLKNIIVE